LSFVPIHFYNKGYVYKDHFIFEKKKLKNFAIFIGANEEIAEKKLVEFSNYLKEFKPQAFEQIKKILKDEERHAMYSLRFAKNNNNFFLYKIKLAKEKIFSFLRHTYANSLNKFFFIFNPILISIILIISVLVRLIKLKKNVTDEDVMNNINPTSVA